MLRVPNSYVLYQFNMEYQLTGWRVHQISERFGFEYAQIFLLDFKHPVFDQFGEGSADGFYFQTQVAADFFAGHAQYQLRLREAA